MSELNFDIKKIKLVPIDQVQPNTWNPKVDGSAEYKKIVKSLKVNGLRGVIVVRETAKDSYEVVDGMQRYTAAKELGFTEVNIYNEGALGDQQAKELTIWYQQQVPFDKIMEAQLVNELLVEYNDSELLPYTDDELNEIKAMADFDFDKFEDDQPQDEENSKLILNLSKGELDEALEILNVAHCSREEAFMDLIRHGEVREP